MSAGRPLEELVAESVEVIERALSLAKKPLIAFSGGKDSIAVALLCRALGVRDAVADVSFYFKSQKADIDRLGRELDLNMVVKEPYTNAFFREHPEMMFPDAKNANLCFEMTHRSTIREHTIAGGFDLVFFGRRTEENYVGDMVIRLKSGAWQCYPIKWWSTVDTMNFARWQGITLPSCYGGAMGEDKRFNDWPFLDRAAYPDPLRAIWKVDPDTIRELAEWHEPARQVMKENEP